MDDRQDLNNQDEQVQPGRDEVNIDNRTDANGPTNVVAIVAVVVLVALLLYGVYAFMNRGGTTEPPVVPGAGTEDGVDIDVEGGVDTDLPPAEDEVAE